MKYLSIALALALSACALDEHYKANISGAAIGTQPDPAARVVLQCDRLGFLRSSDAHRLCVMRGIDRLAIQPAVPYAPITILPYPYPPLSPQHAVPIVPVR